MYKQYGKHSPVFVSDIRRHIYGISEIHRRYNGGGEMTEFAIVVIASLVSCIAALVGGILVVKQTEKYNKKKQAE